MLLQSHAFSSSASTEQAYNVQYTTMFFSRSSNSCLIYPDFASETISEGLKSQIFLGEHVPRPPKHTRALQNLIHDVSISVNWPTHSFSQLSGPAMRELLQQCFLYKSPMFHLDSVQRSADTCLQSMHVKKCGKCQILLNVVTIMSALEGYITACKVNFCY